MLAEEANDDVSDLLPQAMETQGTAEGRTGKFSKSNLQQAGLSQAVKYRIAIKIGHFINIPGFGRRLFYNLDVRSSLYTHAVESSS